MFDAGLLNDDDPNFDSIHFERSAQRAVIDLQRIVGTIAHHYLLPRAHPTVNFTLSWRALLELEEQAFSDLGFQSRHDQAIVAGLLRLSESRLPGSNIDDAVDWRRDDESLPAVYRIVRAIIEEKSHERRLQRRQFPKRAQRREARCVARVEPVCDHAPECWTIARYTVLGHDKYLLWDPGGKARGTFGGIGPAKSAVRRLAREPQRD
jgi:hypothetical protein